MRRSVPVTVLSGMSTTGMETAELVGGARISFIFNEVRGRKGCITRIE